MAGISESERLARWQSRLEFEELCEEVNKCSYHPLLVPLSLTQVLWLTRLLVWSHRNELWGIKWWRRQSVWGLVWWAAPTVRIKFLHTFFFCSSLSWGCWSWPMMFSNRGISIRWIWLRQSSALRFNVFLGIFSNASQLQPSHSVRTTVRICRFGQRIWLRLWPWTIWRLWYRKKPLWPWLRSVIRSWLASQSGLRLK